MINSVNGVNSSFNSSGTYSNKSMETASNTYTNVSDQENRSMPQTAESNPKVLSETDKTTGYLTTEKDKKEEVDEKDLSLINDTLNKFMEKMNSDIRFNYCKELDRLTVQVVNRKNNEVIKEFPPKEMIEVLTGIKEWVGMILDKKA